MEVLDLKKLIKFSPDRISREMLSDKPEMRVALMCLNPAKKPFIVGRYVRKRVMIQNECRSLQKLLI